jgi:hypothetical protein
MPFSITRFLDFIRRPEFKVVEIIMIRKLNLFPSSDVGERDTYTVGPLPRTEADLVSEISFRIPDDGQRPEIQ